MVPDALDLGVDIIVLVSDVLNLGGDVGVLVLDVRDLGLDIGDLGAGVLVLGVDRSPWARVGGRSYAWNSGGGVKREMVNHRGCLEVG